MATIRDNFLAQLGRSRTGPTNTTTLSPGTTTKVFVPCSYCCSLNLALPLLSLITNIISLSVWLKRSLLNCISLFFVVSAINCMLFSLSSIIYASLILCQGIDEAADSGGYGDVHFYLSLFLHTMNSIDVTMMACFHTLIVYHTDNNRWQFWNISRTVQAVVLSVTLSVIIGLLKILLSGALPDSAENTVKIYYTSSKIMSAQMTETLWFYSIIRIGSSTTILILNALAFLNIYLCPNEESSNANALSRLGSSSDHMYEESDEAKKQLYYELGSQENPNDVLIRGLVSRKSLGSIQSAQLSVKIKRKPFANTETNEVKDHVMRNAIKDIIKQRNFAGTSGNNAKVAKRVVDPTTIQTLLGKRMTLRQARAEPETQSREQPQNPFTNLVLTTSLLYVALEFPMGIICYIVSKDPDHYTFFENVANFMDVVPFVLHILNFIAYLTINSDFKSTIKNRLHL